MANDKQIVDDMFQDTLIKIWKAIPNYREQNKFSSWIFSVAHNIAIDYSRKHKSQDKMFDQTMEYDQINLVDPHDEIVAKETEMRVKRLIDTLPDNQRQVFLLRQHGELAFKEIAEIMKQPLSTVLSHMHYAVKKLKKELREENAA